MDGVKKFFNVGGVKATLTTPPDVSKASGKVGGSLTLVTKSPQHVKSVKVIFERKITTVKFGATTPTGQPAKDNTETRFDTLGTFEENNAFDLKPEETKKFDFTITFNLPETAAESLAKQGGVVGAFGAIGRMAEAAKEKIEYQVRAVADVEGAAFDPTDFKSVRIV